MAITTSQKVQGLAIAVFGAYAGGYTEELETAVDTVGLSAVAGSALNIQGILLATDLSEDSVWIDRVLSHLGVTDTDPAYEAAVGAMEDLVSAFGRAAAVVAAVEYLLGDTVADEFESIAAAFQDNVAAAEVFSADSTDLDVGDLIPRTPQPVASPSA